MTSNITDAATLKSTADQQFENRQFLEAEETYTRLCALDPKSVHALHRLAIIHGINGDFNNALPCCEKALTMAPNTAVLYRTYADILVELKRYSDAVHALNRAIILDPSDLNSCLKQGNIHRLLGQIPEAELYFRKALSINPQSVSSTVHLAQLLKDAGKYTEAAKACESTLSYEPADRTLVTTLLECYFLSGNLESAQRLILSSEQSIPNLVKPLYRICKSLHDKSLFDEEKNAIQIVLNVFPDDEYFKLLLADCLCALGCTDQASLALNELPCNELTLEAGLLLVQGYENIGQPDEAKNHLVTLSSRFPDEEIPVARLSRKLVEDGAYSAAESLLGDFLNHKPDAHRILVELGSVNERSGNYDLAEKNYLRAIEIEPRYAIAHDRLGTIYRTKRQDPEALKCFEEAIRCDPKLLTAKCNLAHIHFTNGRYSEAEALYDEALDRAPEFEAAVAGKALVLERIGKVTEALRLVKPFIQRHTDNTHLLLAYAGACHEENSEASATILLEEHLDKHNISQPDRMQTHFVLGKLFDRLEDHEKAFLNYRRGNELNRFPFDREAHQRLVSAIRSTFSPDNVKNFPRSNNLDSSLVFIVGMPRSGTTLTEQILASHPEVFGAGELAHIRDIAAAIPISFGSNKAFPLYIPDIDQDILDQFAADHASLMHSLSTGESIITDKMPSNFMFLGLIELLFPNARILHCVRDPVDTCLSCYFQNFSSGQYFSYNQSDLAFYYNRYQELMTHWKSCLSIPIMEVRYEQLVDDQERTSREIVEFVGLDWHPDCLDFHKSGRKIRTASYHQVRQPVYRSSVRRWEKYSDHLEELKNALDLQQ